MVASHPSPVPNGDDDDTRSVGYEHGGERLDRVAAQRLRPAYLRCRLKGCIQHQRSGEIKAW